MEKEHERLRGVCKSKVQDCCQRLVAVLVDKEKNVINSSDVFGDDKVIAIRNVANMLNVLKKLPDCFICGGFSMHSHG